jgi:hypothetical protein
MFGNNSLIERRNGKMTFEEILTKLDRNFELISCRAVIDLPEEGDSVDIFIGQCKYINKPFPQLIPLDGDIYSMNQRIAKYEVNDDELTVWYETNQE